MRRVSLSWRSGRHLMLPAAGGLALGLGLMVAADDLGPATLPAPGPTMTYLIRDLGDLGGGQAAALAMNDEGLIVGWSTIRQLPTADPASLITDAGLRHAFVWDGRHIIDLGDLGGGTSVAKDINNLDEIVGVSFNARGEQRAAYWFDGEIYDLTDRVWDGPELAPATWMPVELDSLIEANGISDEGFIAACGYVVGDDLIHGFVLEPLPHCGGPPAMYRARDLGRLDPNTECIAYRVNMAGEVVGISGREAFIWDADGIRPIEDAPPPLMGMSEARAINEAGDAVGFGCDFRGRFFACLWRAGVRYDLQTPPLHMTGALDLNESGQVVGWVAKEADGPREAMLWEDRMGRKLNHFPLIPVGPVPGTEWRSLSEATAIDDLGRIAGFGETMDGRVRAFVLFPDI